MAKNDSDLFDRLRRAGLRKQVAKTLSEISEGASKQALRAARSAVGELRSLADELERRLPSASPGASASGENAGGTSTQSPPATPRASRSRAAGRRAQRPVTQRKSAPAPMPKTGAASRSNGFAVPESARPAAGYPACAGGGKESAD